MRVHGVSVQGRSRAENQDAFLADDNLWAVADGVSGLEAGQMAAFLFLYGLRREMAKFHDPAAAENGLYWAQGRMMEYARPLKGMGACGTAAWCAGSKEDGSYPVHLLHIGDSCAKVVAGGVVRRLTAVHTRREGDRMVLDRYVGNRTEADYGDLLEERLPEGAWLLLSTDDVARRVDDPDLVRTIEEFGPRGPREVAERIVNLALAFGASDDLTVVAVHLVED